MPPFANRPVASSMHGLQSKGVMGVGCSQSVHKGGKLQGGSDEPNVAVIQPSTPLRPSTKWSHRRQRAQCFHRNAAFTAHSEALGTPRQLRNYRTAPRLPFCRRRLAPGLSTMILICRKLRANVDDVASPSLSVRRNECPPNLIIWPDQMLGPTLVLRIHTQKTREHQNRPNMPDSPLAIELLPRLNLQRGQPSLDLRLCCPKQWHGVVVGLANIQRACNLEELGEKPIDVHLYIYGLPTCASKTQQAGAASVGRLLRIRNTSASDHEPVPPSQVCVNKDRCWPRATPDTGCPPPYKRSSTRKGRSSGTGLFCNKLNAHLQQPAIDCRLPTKTVPPASAAAGASEPYYWLRVRLKQHASPSNQRTMSHDLHPSAPSVDQGFDCQYTQQLREQT